MPSTYQVPTLKLPGLEAGRGRRYVSPYVRVSTVFYPHAKDPVFPGRDRRYSGGIRVDWDRKHSQAALQTLTWSKANGQAAGQWEVVIKDNFPYQLDVADGDILPGDWVDILVNRNGLEIPLCRGYVETVNGNRAGAGGATVRTWKIAGKDHGVAWTVPISYTNMWIYTLKEVTGGLNTDRFRGNVGGSPRDMFQLLLEGAFGRGTQASPWVLPESMDPAAPLLPGTFDSGGIPRKASLFDALEIERGATRGGHYNEPVLWHQAGQTAHALIQDWCNPLLNETIYDLHLDENYPDTGKALAKIGAKIRERPFVLVEDDLAFFKDGESVMTGFESPWFTLPTWNIPTWICDGIQTGRSGHELFNLFSVIADTGWGGEKGEQFAASAPAWFRDSIERYGLNAMTEHTKYLAGGHAKAGVGWVEERMRWQRLLTNWYCMNPWMLQGPINVKIPLPEVRVGQRLRINNGNPNEIETYYVDGVELRYHRTGTAPPRATTSFTATRGWRGDDRSLIKALTKVVSLYKDQF